jgi:mRNA deadenylase 3'-5' endonuclease subunit Ccr4
MNWAKKMRACHPPHTTYLASWKENIDYIFYNPDSMVVEKLLDMPEK